MTYVPPFPIIPQPSIPMDPLKAARLREQALLKIQQTPTAGAKGNFNDLSDEELDAPPGDPNAGIMPPLPAEAPRATPAANTQQQADTSEEETGPTDIRPQPGDTSDTPVAAAADPLEQALGGDPSEKRSGSFWDNPASSDALIAFGAAMLRAPNFNHGLADGAEAVTKALEPYKMPSRAEVAKLALQARMKRYAAGTGESDNKVEYATPESAIAPDGTIFTGALNKSTGQRQWRNEITGEIVQTLPQGTMWRQDSGHGKAAELSAKAEEENLAIAMDAPGVIASINGLQRDFVDAGGEAGKLGVAKRWLGDLMGSDVFGDIGKRQTMEAVFKQMELSRAKSQRGLGQLTEGERSILREAFVGLQNDPRAFYRITEVEKAHAERSLAIVQEWDNLPSDEKAKYRNNIRRFAVQWDKDNDYQDRLEKIRTAPLPDFMGGSKVAPAPTPAAPSAASKYYDE